MPPESRRVHIVVRGKVQGVWFRESTRQEAERLGVGGWVRNLPTGEVEGLFTGPAGAVQRLVDWCRRGPPGAEVQDLIAEERPGPLEAGFRVIRP